MKTKKKMIIFMMILIFAAGLICPPLYAANMGKFAKIGKIDSIVESIAQGAVKRNGRDAREISSRQTERFQTILRRNAELSESLTRYGKTIDDTMMLRRIDLPPGSKAADAFLSMDKFSKKAILQLSDTINTVLKHPDGFDLLKRLDKQGLLVINKFGNDLIEPMGKILKADHIWKQSETVEKMMKGLNSVQVEKLKKILKSENLVYSLNSTGHSKHGRRVQVLYEVLKKYGKIGMVNLWELTKKLAKKAYKNPKKTAIGAAIIAVWLNPDIVLTPTGRLKDKSLELAYGLGEQIGEIIAGVPIQVAKGIDKGVETELEKHLPDLKPDSVTFRVLNIIISTTIFIGILMLILWVIPFTKFIPKALGANLRKMISRKNKTSTEAIHA